LVRADVGTTYCALSSPMLISHPSFCKEDAHKQTHPHAGFITLEQCLKLTAAGSIPQRKYNNYLGPAVAFQPREKRWLCIRFDMERLYKSQPQSMPDGIPISDRFDIRLYQGQPQSIPKGMSMSDQGECYRLRIFLPPKPADARHIYHEHLAPHFLRKPENGV
jgi:hypothetical protein